MIKTNIQLFFILIVLLSSTSYAQTTCFTVTPVSKARFHQLIEQDVPSFSPSLSVIDQLEQAQQQLGERLYLTEHTFELRDLNGHVLVQETQLEQGHEFIAYYPDEDLLYLKDWLGSDRIFELTTGEEHLEVPSSRRYSPRGQYRMTRYYNGQDVQWLIQANNNGQWRTLHEQLATPSAERHFYMIDQFSWLSEEQFVFRRWNTERYFLGSIHLSFHNTELNPFCSMMRGVN